MAPIKRKGKDATDGIVQQPEKRVRVGAGERKESERSGRSKPKSSSQSVSAGSNISILQDEAPSFPRGGASVLTPLERKQIQKQATKDVLFEQKGPKRRTDDADVNDEDDDDTEKSNEPAAPIKKSHKKKRKSKRGPEPKNSGEAGVRIEGLNFKVLMIQTISSWYFYTNEYSALFRDQWFWAKYPA